MRNTRRHLAFQITNILIAKIGVVNNSSTDVSRSRFVKGGKMTEIATSQLIKTRWNACHFTTSNLPYLFLKIIYAFIFDPLIHGAHAIRRSFDYFSENAIYYSFEPVQQANYGWFLCTHPSPLFLRPLVWVDPSSDCRGSVTSARRLLAPT